jgi:uncharacterized protein (DUF302 family)
MSGNIAAGSGVVVTAAKAAVGEIIDRLEASLRERGVLIFARIDFCADAGRAGLTMRPEQLLLFGNPRAGTPLLRAAPAVGLDLPLRALAWEDEQGRRWLAWNDPQYIVARHGLDAQLAANLAAVTPLLQLAAQ